MFVKSLSRFEKKLIPTIDRCIYHGNILCEYTSQIVTKCSKCNQAHQTKWIVYSCSNDGCDYFAVSCDGEKFYRVKGI